MILPSVHTDNAGTDEANRRLSNLRAQAVRDYLVHEGIAPQRLTCIAYGATRPALPTIPKKNALKTAAWK
ncbi:MAG: OmpA family protein [Bacteroidales bacterium]|nr:OmpA family protein [Bacteroidales bacterium]